MPSDPRPSNHAPLVSMQLRLCPAAEPTRDVEAWFDRVPVRGEQVMTLENELFVVVEVIWNMGGVALIIAHDYTRPRAQEALHT